MKRTATFVAMGLALASCCFSRAPPEAGGTECTELVAKLIVGGQDLGVADGASFEYRIRVTDLMEIDASGSCAPDDVQYSWTIPVGYLGDRQDGAERVAVFAPEVGTETITLEVSDAESSVEISFAVESVGLQELPYVDDVASSDDNIEGVTVAGQRVWLAMRFGGILVVDPTNPHAPGTDGSYDIAVIADQAVNPRLMFAKGETAWAISNPGGDDPLYRLDTSTMDFTPGTPWSTTRQPV